MTFIDKVTGNDMNREYKDMKLRVSKLPVEYQEAWDQIFVNLSMHSNFSGRNLTPLYSGVLDMFEEMHSQDKTVDEIFGGNIDEFCDELTRDEPSFDIRDKWRKQLNAKIEKRFK